MSRSDAPKKGWLKEIKSGGALPKKELFKYKAPVTPPKKTDGMNVIQRTKEFKTVAPDKKNSFSTEQKVAKASHKHKG